MITTQGLAVPRKSRSHVNLGHILAPVKRNFRVPISRLLMKLFLLRPWMRITFNQCERSPRACGRRGNCLVPGFIRKFEQERASSAFTSMGCTYCFLLVCCQCRADSRLKDEGDYETRIQTGKLKDSGSSQSYLGWLPSTNVSSKSQGRNLSHQFICKFLSYTTILRIRDSGYLSVGVGRAPTSGFGATFRFLAA